MDSGTQLWLSLVLSSIGVGYFVYGKKQGRFVPMLSGGILCTFGYFVTNPLLLTGCALVLILLPFLARA